MCTECAYPLDVAGADDFGRVGADHPLEPQLVHVKGRAVEVHQGHRRREIEAAAREDSEKFNDGRVGVVCAAINHAAAEFHEARSAFFRFFALRRRARDGSGYFVVN